MAKDPSELASQSEQLVPSGTTPAEPALVESVQSNQATAELSDNPLAVARGLAEADGANPENTSAPSNEDKRRGSSLYQKLQKWLVSTNKPKGDAGKTIDSRPTTVVGGAATIPPELLDYLNNLQKRQYERAIDTKPLVLLRSALVVRQVIDQAPQGSLTPVAEKSIELLAKIFDFLLNEQGIPADLRIQIGRLQIPLLKVALFDNEFFFKREHPARRLLETLAMAGMRPQQDGSLDDPLRQLIEQIVERIQLEFHLQLELFAEELARLDAFITDESQILQKALSEPIAAALLKEKLEQAQEQAEHEVALRVETGEVAGFVEKFLEQQWIPILAMAYGNADSRPEALEHAIKTMDELIWSLKPKFSLEERKNLVARLPAILSMMNGWLNTGEWDESERVLFFSKLAERHAAVVRAPLELSPRRQVEMAVNVAQKASIRQMSGQAKKLKRRKLDEFVQQVDAIECGTCIEFVRDGDRKLQFNLAWISPKRGHFIFANSGGDEVFDLSTDELAQAFRSKSAAIVPITSVVDCALATALDEIGSA